jgi:hypothetical protein
MPTIKQKKAFDEITENHRSVSDAMRVAGYDEDTASKPSNLTNSKGFQELLAEYLPDKTLQERHQAFLYSENEVIGVKALDMAYKLKGSYAPEKSQSINLNVNASVDADDPKRKALVDEFENKLFNQYQDE